MKYLILFLVFLFTSCDNCGSVPPNSESYQEVSLGVCLNTSLKKSEYICNNEADFKNLLTENQCSNNTAIDFTKKTLLGKYTEGQCNLTIKKSIIKNEVNKTYTYNILTCSKGSCKSKAMNMNWILVDKVPQEYKLIFDLKSTK